MFERIGNLADRLLALVVPEVNAEAASIQAINCGCWRIEKPGHYRRFLKICDSCLCYEAGAC